MAAGSVARGRSGLLAGVWLLLTGYDRYRHKPPAGSFVLTHAQMHCDA